MPKGYARIDRIAEQVQRELAQLLRLDVKDPRVRMITITGVEVNRDYSHAKVFYTSLDGASDAVQNGLEHASGYLRSQLAHSMKLRVLPQLHFMYDPSIERGAHLSQLIDQAIASDNIPRDPDSLA
ncbi:MAG: 30S ribosome-binding factor RbfA [Candidatus Nitrotoga sp.]|jgi:ribosome-binding factor A|nr:30S ribosome-binding factor RbfA [Pseudomonadota bacterium]MDW7535485.1 30S ribosome-binding factor RbfA [Candidatus Nitrotoga sp.]MDW7604992.1 30S ribosome-binding factor RbfA [Candidatus Nitrotoga sp.]MDW7612891.1 30S ribosome-binding factor RbfA [Candidatus Nitrotoga sp.]MDW7626156.1 30S ribosome-binding factor RbfA [Candidatus Nitrotoga sp.]